MRAEDQKELEGAFSVLGFEVGLISMWVCGFVVVVVVFLIP